MDYSMPGFPVFHYLLEFGQTYIHWVGDAIQPSHPLLLSSLLALNLSQIARRGKEAFLSEQCKEIEENNRMGKTADLFKKTRDTKGTFHSKMDTIKDRNSILDISPLSDKWFANIFSHSLC